MDKYIKWSEFIFFISIPVLTFNLNNYNLELTPTICIMKNLFNMDCIGCGSTKAIIAFVNGNFNQGINYNFNVIFTLPILIYIWINQIIKLFKILINK